ncbi:serine/threonine protein kinase [Mycolicibacterium pulveris]|uniref:non-specific serine/threonine protein kinase n=1 Tax=Mycolicibacterium pulveris TaxID=36813 RepID=A0A7I7ULY4_MYCPV|nr:serine/threonine-protein kinase [Mycolicibacterium pulveris]MCV6980490.1 serine/threonine protein kinase [Mycolicibacterium pulveris]BBY81883.1 protein kinase [Mycolicibacterium pulveris]
MQAPEILGGRYELRSVLGRGGMSEVRDGWDTRLDRPVAIKLLHPMLLADPVTRGRFEREARAAAALSHPNIVAVHDSGEHNGTPFIVMERLSGHTLADLIAGGPLRQPQLRFILDDVLSALATAHTAGIVHRDIKPANILFSDSGHTKVADFGIAKSAATPDTVTGQIVGTMAYLSPQRIAGAPATACDDLYALGVVGYEALTGRRAFPQENLAELARAITDGAPAPVAALRPDADPVLAATVERAMAPDPRWRFGSAQSMSAALAGRFEPPAGHRPPTKVLAAPLPAPTTMAVRPPAPKNRTRVLLGVAAALVAVVVTLAAVIAESASRPPPAPASTSTTVPTTPPPPSLLPPPPPPAPAQVEQGPPWNSRGENGRGPKGPKGPKGPDGPRGPRGGDDD